MSRRTKKLHLAFESLESRHLMAGVTGAGVEDGIVTAQDVANTPADSSGGGSNAAGDEFNDGVFNSNGVWDPTNITQGGAAPATITYDEQTNPGSLRITYNSTGQSQTTMILRTDAALAVGEYVKVDVKIISGPASPNVRIGLGLASSLGRNSMGGVARSNVVYWGVRNDGIVRGHYYGANNAEIGDSEATLNGYAPGQSITLAIKRVTATQFELYSAPTGQALQLASTFSYTGATGAGETPPTIPGLFIDNGLSSFTALVDNFEVVAAQPPGQDNFNDGVFNLDGKWDPNNVIQGGTPAATINFDEVATAGSLRINYISAGAGQTTMVLRKDLSLGVGEYVQVDVAIAAGAATGDVRVGLGLASTLGRNAMGGQDRENVLYWGLRNDGIVRGHAYGDNGTEITDGGTATSGYAPGKFMTIAIRRISTNTYALYYATTGQPLQLATSFNYTGSTGPGEAKPVIPGLFFDTGLASFTAIVDNFKVSNGWPPAVNPSRPNAPQESIPHLPGHISLDLGSGVATLPKLEGTQHQVNFPVGNGDNTYHHNTLMTKWKGKFYMAWTSTPENEMTLPYTALVSSSVDGETWSTPLNAGIASGGDAAYIAYMRNRYSIPAGEAIANNAAPRHWHATEDKLYLWNLGWITRADGNREWVGRIWYTDDGATWHEMAPQTLDALEANQGLLVRDSGSNRGFVELRDGRLMAATIGNVVAGGRVAAPITSDPTGLTGWSGGVIDTSANSDVGEPTAWEGPDGTLHYAARGPNTAVWHSYSTDGGATWSALAPMPSFPDNPGNKQFGTLSNGWNWYIGNPLPGSRQELIFSISRDGYSFDESYVVRDEPITPIWPSEYKSGDRPGYEYPAAYYDEATDTLYLAYSRTRDYIEVTKVANANLLPPTGDYNEDRVVDQADFAFWKSHFGATSGAGLAADGNGNGVVDTADYTIWRDNLGATSAPPVMTSGGGSTAPGLSVTEGDESISSNVQTNLRATLVSVATDDGTNRLIPRLQSHRHADRQTAREVALDQLLLNATARRFSRSRGNSESADGTIDVVAENVLPSDNAHAELFADADFRKHRLAFGRLNETSTLSDR
jgi:hypothetical protein